MSAERGRRIERSAFLLHHPLRPFPPFLAIGGVPHPPMVRKDLWRTIDGTCVMKYVVRETHSAS